MSEIQKPEVLVVSRYMDPADQAKLHAKLTSHDRDVLGALDRTELSRGHAAVRLFGAQAYDLALNDPAGTLDTFSTEDSMAIIGEKIGRDKITSGWLDVITIGTDTVPDGDRNVIFFELASDRLVEEADDVGHVVATLNDTTADWVSPATTKLELSIIDRDDGLASRIVRALEDIRPEIIRLMPAVVETVTEAGIELAGTSRV